MTDVEPTGAVHPFAEKFPLLEGEELQDLADDIAANGLRHPLVLDAGGVLLDGRNRLRACRLAGVAPTYTTLPDGTDSVAYILSGNVARRHLNKGQIAMAVARAQTFSSGKFQGKSTLAKSVGVSGSMLAKASTVLTYAPELTDGVIAGDPSLNAAYAIAQHRKDPAVVETTLELNAITRDTHFYSRVAPNPDVVAAYARAYKRGTVLPPLEVMDVDGTLYLIGGWMRYEALQRIGAETAPVTITKGTISDAHFAAAGQNTRHGIYPTTAFKRRLVVFGLQAVNLAVGGDHADDDIDDLEAIVARELRTVDAVETALEEMRGGTPGDWFAKQRPTDFDAWLQDTLRRWAAAPNLLAQTGS